MYDILIIGGGINGAGIARDAAGRGFQTCLIEKNKIVDEIKKIYDPEIPVNIYELGLIYKIEISDEKKVNIEMTLTSPNCPVAESLPKMVKDNVLKIEEVSDVGLKLVWSPPWTKDMMSEEAKLDLGMI